MRRAILHPRRTTFSMWPDAAGITRKREVPVSHRNLLLAALLFAPLCALASTSGDASCAQTNAPVILRYASFPPLLGGGEHTATRISVHDDGCVVVQLPERSMLSGTHAMRLDKKETAAIHQQIAAWQLQQIDTRKLRNTLDTAMKQRLSQKSQVSVTAVRDEPLIRFEILQHGKALGTLLYATAQQDWANHPENAEVRVLHQAKETMDGLLLRAIASRKAEVSP